MLKEWLAELDSTPTLLDPLSLNDFNASSYERVENVNYIFIWLIPQDEIIIIIIIIICEVNQINNQVYHKDIWSGVA